MTQTGVTRNKSIMISDQRKTKYNNNNKKKNTIQLRGYLYVAVWIKGGQTLTVAPPRLGKKPLALSLWDLISLFNLVSSLPWIIIIIIIIMIILIIIAIIIIIKTVIIVLIIIKIKQRTKIKANNNNNNNNHRQ